uniref:TatD related DNase n=1 Tax=Arcella intermedia TaxID=1963864 RepID=A0A6B2LJY3_9EUKA
MESCPRAVVGEIGVDKVYKANGVNTFATGHQQQLFHIQVDLAIELKRPINVHCVQAHGWLFDFFRDIAKDKTKAENLPPVLLHSFTGSADMVTGLLKIPKVGKKFYFSFSAIINLTNSSKKLDAAIQIVPEDRLLLESDWNYCSNQEKGMSDIIGYISKMRNWTVDQTITISTQNATTFFSI